MYDVFCNYVIMYLFVIIWLTYHYNYDIIHYNNLKHKGHNMTQAQTQFELIQKQRDDNYNIIFERKQLKFDATAMKQLQYNCDTIIDNRDENNYMMGVYARNNFLIQCYNLFDMQQYCDHNDYLSIAHDYYDVFTMTYCDILEHNLHMIKHHTP